MHRDVKPANVFIAGEAIAICLSLLECLGQFRHSTSDCVHTPRKYRRDIQSYEHTWCVNHRQALFK